MTLQGTIHADGKSLFVRYETTFENEPTRQILFWKIERVTRNPYAIGAWPQHGDPVTSSGNDWHGRGYSVYFRGDVEASKIVREPVPCPKVRPGVQTRWYRGHWEKLLKRGWVPA